MATHPHSGLTSPRDTQATDGRSSGDLGVGRERLWLDVDLVHARGVRAVGPPRVATTPGLVECRHETEVGALVVRVPDEQPEEVAGRGIGITGLGGQAWPARARPSRTCCAPRRADRSPSRRTSAPRGSPRRRALPPRRGQTGLVEEAAAIGRETSHAAARNSATSTNARSGRSQTDDAVGADHPVGVVRRGPGRGPRAAWTAPPTAGSVRERDPRRARAARSRRRASPAGPCRATKIFRRSRGLREPQAALSITAPSSTTWNPPSERITSGWRRRSVLRARGRRPRRAVERRPAGPPSPRTRPAPRRRRRRARPAAALPSPPPAGSRAGARSRRPPRRPRSLAVRSPRMPQAGVLRPPQTDRAAGAPAHRRHRRGARPRPGRHDRARAIRRPAGHLLVHGESKINRASGQRVATSLPCSPSVRARPASAGTSPWRSRLGSATTMASSYADRANVRSPRSRCTSPRTARAKLTVREPTRWYSSRAASASRAASSSRPRPSSAKRAVEQRERTEVARPAQLGRRQRHLELGQGVFVRALLEEGRRPVAADAGDLQEVADPLGMLERPDVVDLVRPAVTGERRRHRQRGLRDRGMRGRPPPRAQARVRPPRAPGIARRRLASTRPRPARREPARGHARCHHRSRPRS